MSPREALKIAEAKGLDLVEIVPNAKPPVCKIVDYGKFRYEAQKREKIQKKKQAVIEVKEIRFHPNTDEHDFEFKARHCRQFLIDGYKVKATVIYKGRELIYPEKGEELLNRLIEKVNDVARVESPPKFEGRSMTTILIYDKSKAKKSN